MRNCIVKEINILKFVSLANLKRQLFFWQCNFQTRCIYNIFEEGKRMSGV